MRVPASLAMRRQVLPFAAVGGVVYVACATWTTARRWRRSSAHVRLPICARQAEPESLRRALDRVFGGNVGAGAGRARRGEAAARPTADAEGAVAACDELMHAAIVRQASDIHIDPDEKQSHVRLRVDGVLEQYRTLAAGRASRRDQPLQSAGRHGHRREARPAGRPLHPHLRPGRPDASTSAWPRCPPSTANA